MNVIRCSNPRFILHPNFNWLIWKHRRYVFNGETQYYVMRDELIDFNGYIYAKFSPKNNNIGYHNIDEYYIVTPDGEQIPMYMAVPCRKCSLCRKKLANEYAIRCVCESQYSQTFPLFVTLTFSPENCPEDGVKKEDVQLYIKRLRSRLEYDGYDISKLRYIYCGEYGRQHGLPHYHIIFWNFPFMKDYMDVINYCQETWSYGNMRVKRCNYGSIYYVLKYMRKKPVNPLGYPNPVFFEASRGGRSGQSGIGSQWIIDNAKLYLDNPALLDMEVRDKFTNRKFKCSLPQYFLSKLFPSFSRMVPANCSKALDLFNSSLMFKSVFERYYGKYFLTGTCERLINLNAKIFEVFAKFPHKLYNLHYV